MRILKKIFSAVIAFAMLFGAFRAGAYQTACNNSSYATKVENQKSSDACIAYALLSSAGIYAVKNNELSLENADFDENLFLNKTEKSHNYGEVIYNSVGFSIGNGSYITSIENLSVRGERYIKQKIKENGSVCVAVSLPDGGMNSKEYFNEKSGAFYCPEKKADSGEYHAFSVVGWDDSYSKLNFNESNRPNANGAWLCKNSYGKEYGNDGYFYLSYQTVFHYSTAIEVTEMKDVYAVKTADRVVFVGGYIAAIGFSLSSEMKNAEVEIIINKEKTLKFTKDIIKGYNFIAFESPERAVSISVSVNGENINGSSVNCYLTKNRECAIKQSNLQKEADWNETVDNITIRPSGKNYVAYSVIGGKSFVHSVELNAESNRFRITPCDGISFDENMKSDIKLKVNESDEPITESDVEICSSEYLSLDEDGKISFDSLDIGGCFIKKVNILTDEKSLIESVTFIYDNNSEKTISADELEIGFYDASENVVLSPDEFGKSVDYVSGKESYRAVIKLPAGAYFSEDSEILINGKKSDSNSSILFDEKMISIDIDIPSVTSNIIEIITNILVAILSIFTKIRN